MGDQAATANGMGMAGTDLDGLRSKFRGALLSPGDGGYDEARRVWNGAIDRRPALIARCAGKDDVMAAVRFGRERDLLTSIRGGGHGVSGTAVCDDGLMIDLSPMRDIHVNPDGMTARAQGGVLWGEFDRETQAFGLATTGGIVTHTGIAGLTLGGGIGWLMRRFGTTADNLLSVELVTADGELVTASRDENPDLFWGMRGAGANFGVVTSFEYRLHPVGPQVLAGPIFFPMEDSPQALRFYRDWVEDAPDELMTILNLRKAPPAPYLPPGLHGRPVCGVMTCWSGDIERGLQVLRPLREFGRPLIDLIQPKPYLAHQSMLDPGVPHGWHYYWKSCDLPAFTDGMIDDMASHSAAITSPRSYSLVFQLGGAVSRVAEDGTAYAHRDARHNVNINGVWTEEEGEPSRHVAWTREFFQALEPHSPGVYVNFLGDEGEERVRAAYGPGKYDRLLALKRRYDPDNFFRLNQNIKPS
jgi:FAD/FMN-containing dehydrogenase